MTAVVSRPSRRHRHHVMPPELAERTAPAALVRAWGDVARRGRTCWYCGVVYLRASDADECELAAERGLGRPSALNGPPGADEAR